MQVMELIEINCPVCSSDKCTIMYPDSLGANPPLFGYKWVPDVRKMYRVVRCKSCGHVYCSPRLKDMYKYYTDVSDDVYLANERQRVKTSELVIPIIQRFCPSGKLLDVGCSTGDFVHTAAKHFNAEGLELSQWASQIARNKGVNLHTKSLSEMNEKDGLYDVVTMWGVIEHLENPKDEILHVNRLLRQNGVLCFWTGNVDSLFSKILRQRWPYMLGQHIQFFSKKSLDRLMRDCGFERAYMGIYPYTISFDYFADILNRYFIIGNITRFFVNLLALKERDFVIKKPDEMFAIYRKTMDHRPT
ncbi:type 12 methyltransferase [Candidatus Omnitrophus magneticus]|uniref:Type 12 methyltransferase n=1 Tax=Candidatus Omnitrophus magneticus TaxID=1609969 RepID=A0A0F0CQY0_9BACT|nr:type 12 methyltransferase [Candidatus Omnitrophus magneticus]